MRLWHPGFTSNFGWLVVVTSMIGCCGCSNRPEFRVNQVELQIQKNKLFEDEEDFPSHIKNDLANIVTALFGTPDEPYFPFLEGDDDPAHKLVELENLRIAAGPVSSEQDGKHLGLYREHCSQCHGITGDGRGPTSGFLNPYPRDFRMGRFKFKSTKGRTPPTDHDLTRVIQQGIPGTAMPSFKLLPDEEIDALVDYVKYLSIRGQFERLMIVDIDQYIDDEGFAPLLNWAVESGAEEDDAESLEDQLFYFVDEYLIPVVQSWLKAEKSVSPVPEVPSDLADNPSLVDQGRQLFLGKANCGQCHGSTGLGDGQTANYDLWTLNWLETPGVDAAVPSSYADFIAAGAFPPRPMKPRNLRLRVFRGGNRPEDVYRRISNGIDGTPMPAGSALEEQEIWALVAYMMNLPDEPLTGNIANQSSNPQSNSSGELP